MAQRISDKARQHKNEHQREYAKQTNYAASKKWNRANYQTYTISLRKDRDAEIIEYIENEKQSGKGITELFREIFDVFKMWK